jgi:spore germination protein YaaH
VILALVIALLGNSSLMFATVAFEGIWAYLMDGEEKFLESTFPVSDVGYFGAGLSSFGKLTGVPDRSKIASYPGRVHLVVAEVTNQALTHFVLNPGYPLRDGLVSDIVRASAGFDGVQIDFEMVHPSDGENFAVFLALLRRGLPPELELSVAVPARVRKINDAYDYDAISRIADRVVIMAYDEHWSGSAPGSIASMEWCRRVLDYALATVQKDKIIMGLPFYGRAWADHKHAKAYKNSSLQTLIKDKKVKKISRSDTVPWFVYDDKVRVTVYFEDAVSIRARSLLYNEAGVSRISFWRLGQEDPAVWKELEIRK